MKITGDKESWISEPLMSYAGDTVASRRNGTHRTQMEYQSFTLFANGDLVLGDKAWAAGDPIDCQMFGLTIHREAGSYETRIVSPMGEFILLYQYCAIFGRVFTSTWWRLVKREVPAARTREQRSFLMSVLMFPLEAFVWVLSILVDIAETK